MDYYHHQPLLNYSNVFYIILRFIQAKITFVSNCIYFHNFERMYDYTILFWLILCSLNENNEVVLESCKERSGKMEVHSKLAANVVSQPNVVSYELYIMENCVIKSEASNYVRYWKDYRKFLTSKLQSKLKLLTYFPRTRLSY